MKNYETILIINPNLSSKVADFQKKFDKLLSDNYFEVKKVEDIGRRQLAYSINNHHKGHYLLYRMQGNPQNIAEIETKIKYDEAIIRHLILTVEELSGEDSILLTEALENKSRRVEAVEESPRKIIKEESNVAPAEDSNKKSEES
ncbi:30S ribosomal protein S6 [Gammaproteobacteria bacterium]|nr:30S ribosomal protein S6 [Gammaproteobacteria bacterium]